MRTTAGIAATKEETSPVQEQKKGEGLKTNKQTTTKERKCLQSRSGEGRKKRGGRERTREREGNMKKKHPLLCVCVRLDLLVIALVLGGKGCP